MQEQLCAHFWLRCRFDKLVSAARHGGGELSSGGVEQTQLKQEDTGIQTQAIFNDF